MATAILNGQDASVSNSTHMDHVLDTDPFLTTHETSQTRLSHRYSSHFDPEFFTLGPSSSPSQVKRTLEAHLSETERRLRDTQQLGTTLLQQQSELADRLQEVEKQQDEAEISPELRQRLTELEKEHNDVGKEIARALLGPKSRAVSAEEKQSADSPAAFSSQATGSPTKVLAPSRKQRNQPASRVGDIQFAADISTSLLAQVRQMQAMLAERDEALKSANLEKARLEQDAEGFSARLRALDESEQRYKDENWNLETQAHELKTAAQEASDREKRLNITLAAALAEKSRAQNDLDEVKMAHEKLSDDHATAKKTHDLELHSLKRDLDLGDSERDLLQSKIDELTLQNQDLARAMATRFRGQNADAEQGLSQGQEEAGRGLSTPEHSPPPSPTKATPRHGGLESETLKSSLHHAHRMIQNLKGSIHREKTDKIELKRMLEDARTELEQRRTDGTLGSGNKRQKTKSETFKKPLRPDMLGGSRRTRTDVEVEDEDWIDHAGESRGQLSSSRNLSIPGAFETPRTTDVSDAYQTATETEGTFETADERHGTESDDFQTGAESLAGDSTDELTEREDNTGRSKPRSSLAFKPAGDRSSYLSTASTSAGEEEDDLRTPVQATAQKFRLKNGRHSLARQSRAQREGTPETFYNQVISQDSPATINNDRSPPAAEQSLFTELGGFDDASSDRYSTPGRASIASQKSTPSGAFTGDRGVRNFTAIAAAKAPMVNSSMMTEPWEPEPRPGTDHYVRDSAGSALLGSVAGYSFGEHQIPPASPSDFPLPPSIPTSPPKRTDNSTQYTPSKGLQESPLRNIPTFITPPKTVWDEAQDGEKTPDGYTTGTAMTPQRPLGFSGVVGHDTTPLTPETGNATPVAAPAMAFSSIQTLETAPVEPVRPSHDSTTLPMGEAQLAQDRPGTAQKVAGGVVAGGLLATAAAALGLSKSKDSQSPVVAEDETSGDLSSPSTTRQLPLNEISGNSGSRPVASGKSAATASPSDSYSPVGVSRNDQSSQTLLTSNEIDEALRAKKSPPLVVPGVAPQTPQPQSPAVVRTPSRNRDGLSTAEAAPLFGSAAALKRPASANSQRTPSMTSHPPLPSDHRNVIARASSSGVPATSSPGREPSNSSHIATIMGPPIAPASAYRRPHTPAESSVRSPTRNGTTPRARYSTRDRSNLSRRSSVSSFASELDERFNIRTEQTTASHGFEPGPGTDPRMIQAITQTMIGEFLWKYTRKPGSTDMSSTRHRRYFWVHPYTKTLYWSNTDPQSAGRSELKAKSVLIQSVRVVSDDNPMPPGLHRKSLEIVSLGRKVKVTASTGQRHETWFNALSYLLQRTDVGKDALAGGAGTEGITDADVDEFRVGGYGYGADQGRSLLKPTGSRASVSSYNSRGTSANRSVVRMPAGVVATNTAGKRPAVEQGTATSRSTVVRSSSHQEQNQARHVDHDRTLRPGSVSRFSRMLGSVTGRGQGQGREGEAGSLHGRDHDDAIYNASVVSGDRRDSAEELRKEMLRQERDGLGPNGRLENVRSCCDGKHDVSTLNHAGRHANATGHGHRHSSTMDRINQSVNRRGVGSVVGPKQ